MRTVIVDDSPKVRAELRLVLTRLGYQVIAEAENGLEALKCAEQLQPDLMTLDIIMPDMDGIECYRNLRNLANPPRVLIISALAAEPRVVQTYTYEILSTHFLKKPVNEKDLKERLLEVLAVPPLPLPPQRELSEGTEYASLDG